MVFSNAAMQWVPDHSQAFPRLLKHVAPGGALAVQMPANFESRRASPDARRGVRLSGDRRRSRMVYPFRRILLRRLTPLAARVELWSTEYVHVLDGPEGIVKWYSGTGMRPFLDALPTDAERERFKTEYLAAIRDVYPARPDGHALFPFRRLFIVAYR